MEDSQSKHQQMIRCHHREKKELQARIQAMKSLVPKNDKKRRKQLLLHVAHLEAAMGQKRQQELEKFEESLPDNSSITSVTEGLAKMDLENQPPHVSRAQRRRERKAAFERQHQARMAEAKMEHLASFQHE
ncbi:hypothetical protein MC885_003603 [Smutsia gigantea]|nr:hypothetical protein MC885_003603 [Smutsia gigantea]